MPGIVGLVAAISADVVAKIAAAGLPPLADGGIVLGKSRVADNAPPPRILFIPKSFRFEAPSPGVNVQPISPTNPNAPGFGVRSYTMTQYGGGYVPGSTPVTVSAPDVASGVQATAVATVSSNGSVVRIVPQVVGSGYLKAPTVTIGGAGTNASATANLTPTPQALTVARQRAIWTEWHLFEVHCWATTSTNGTLTPDGDLDYDAAQQLYQQVISSAQAIAAGVYMPSQGAWFDADADATVYDVLGRKARFMLEIATPLLAEPMVPTTGASVQYAPPQTQANPTLYLQPIGGGTPEQG